MKIYIIFNILSHLPWKSSHPIGQSSIGSSISHHQLILSRCYGGASIWPNWSRSCEDSIGSPRDSPQRPGWAWGNAAEILQQWIQHDSTNQKENLCDFGQAYVNMAIQAEQNGLIEPAKVGDTWWTNKRRTQPGMNWATTRIEFQGRSRNHPVCTLAQKGFPIPWIPLAQNPIIIHYLIDIKCIFPSVISYPMYIPMIIHYPMNIPIMPWISHGTHRFSREHAGHQAHPGPPRSLASAWTAASDISMEWLRRLAGLAGLPSSWIQRWQCVKTNSTPVVHIKIAGIYGCSFP